MFKKGLKKFTNLMLFSVIFTLISYVSTYWFSPGTSSAPGKIPVAHGDIPGTGIGGSGGGSDADGCDSDSDSDCDSDGQ